MRKDERRWEKVRARETDKREDREKAKMEGMEDNAHSDREKNWYLRVQQEEKTDSEGMRDREERQERQEERLSESDRDNMRAYWRGCLSIDLSSIFDLSSLFSVFPLFSFCLNLCLSSFLVYHLSLSLSLASVTSCLFLLLCYLVVTVSLELVCIVFPFILSCWSLRALLVSLCLRLPISFTVSCIGM